MDKIGITVNQTNQWNKFFPIFHYNNYKKLLNKLIKQIIGTKILKSRVLQLNLINVTFFGVHEISNLEWKYIERQYIRWSTWFNLTIRTASTLRYRKTPCWYAQIKIHWGIDTPLWPDYDYCSDRPLTIRKGTSGWRQWFKHMIFNCFDKWVYLKT